MSERRWTAYDALATYLTSELNSIGNGSNVLGAAIDFTAAGVDRVQFLDVEATISTVDLSAQVNPAIYLWVLARTDGTNFEDGGTAVNPARQPDGIIPLRAVNTAQQKVFTRLMLTTPDQAKILYGNRAGAGFNSANNTLKYYTYGDSIV